MGFWSRLFEEPELTEVVHARKCRRAPCGQVSCQIYWKGYGDGHGTGYASGRADGASSAAGSYMRGFSAAQTAGRGLPARNVPRETSPRGRGVIAAFWNRVGPQETYGSDESIYAEGSWGEEQT